MKASFNLLTKRACEEPATDLIVAEESDFDISYFNFANDSYILCLIQKFLGTESLEFLIGWGCIGCWKISIFFFFLCFAS